jgi:hypothetical protein
MAREAAFAAIELRPTTRKAAETTRHAVAH